MLFRSKRLPLWSRVVAKHLIESSYHTHHILEGEFGIVIGHWDGGWFDRLMRGVQNKILWEIGLPSPAPTILHSRHVFTLGQYTTEEMLTYDNNRVRQWGRERRGEEIAAVIGKIKHSL